MYKLNLTALYITEPKNRLLLFTSQIAYYKNEIRLTEDIADIVLGVFQLRMNSHTNNIGLGREFS